MSRLSLIDGKDVGELAPKPRAGLVKIIYEILEALGQAHYRKIKEYIPAAVTKASQVTTEVKLKRCLYNGVYRGYFQHEDTKGNMMMRSEKNIKRGTWKIASLDYYNQRQSYLTEMANDDLRHKHQPEKIQQDIDIIKETNWPITVAVGVSCFLAGLSIGVFVGSLAQ